MRPLLRPALRLALAAACVAGGAALPAGPARAAADGPPAGAAAEQAVMASLPPEERTLLVMLRLPPPHFRPDASYGGRYLDDGGRGARRRTALALARQHGLTLVDDWPMPLLGVDCYVMQYPHDARVGAILTQLARDPQVEWAQPVAQFRGQGDDGGDGLYPVQPAARAWHLSDLHRVTTGRDVNVAVVDSGVDGRHPDLTGQLAAEENFVGAGASVPEAHGTAVAGIIAARAGNGGILGVAPQARLMALRACWQLPDHSTRCNSFTLAKAINYAIEHGARIINLSLSGPPDRLLERLLDVALARRISVVGAVDPQGGADAFPATHRGVLAIAVQPPARAGVQPALALRADGVLRAPGTDIPTTAPGARWVFVSGSSYAAAHVSGMLALLDQLQPGASPAQLRRLLQSNETLNAGTIDACATISLLTRTCSCSCGGAVATSRPAGSASLATAHSLLP